MKNFLAGIAIVMLIIIFPLQGLLDFINNYRSQAFTDAVNQAAKTARLDGYFRQETIDKLKSDLKKAYPDLLDSDIYIDVTTSRKYRTYVFDERETINYDIRVPIKKIVVAPAFWGITESDNRAVAQRKSFVLSEVWAP